MGIALRRLRGSVNEKALFTDETLLGEAKTKATNSDYHKNEPLAAARQAEVAWDYF